MRRFGVKVMFAVMILTTLCAPSTYADTTPERRLTISPLQTDLVIAAGTQSSGELVIGNTGSKPLTISLSATSFTVSNTSYDYDFHDAWIANSWITFSKDTITLQPKSSEKISYKVSIPLDADPGDHYLSLFAQSSPDETVGIATAERVGTLLFITIPGAISKDGNLLGITSPLVSFRDISWSATIQNVGSVQFKTTYDVSIQTITGAEIGHSTGSRRILANSVRLVSDTLKAPQWLGIYKLEYSFQLGDNLETTQTRYTLFLPPLQLGLLVLIILSVVGGIGLRRRKPRRNTSSSEE